MKDWKQAIITWEFQSTLPARGATNFHGLVGCAYEFQSTLPARGATRVSSPVSLNPDISIHAPREGSDLVAVQSHLIEHISIHAPREGSDSKRAQKEKIYFGQNAIFCKALYKISTQYPINGYFFFSLCQSFYLFQVRTGQGFHDRFLFARLKNQRVLRQISLLTAKVFDLILIALSQIIKSQAVFLWIHDGA